MINERMVLFEEKQIYENFIKQILTVIVTLVMMVLMNHLVYASEYTFACNPNLVEEDDTGDYSEIGWIAYCESQKFDPVAELNGVWQFTGNYIEDSNLEEADEDSLINRKMFLIIFDGNQYGWNRHMTVGKSEDYYNDCLTQFYINNLEYGEFTVYIEPDTGYVCVIQNNKVLNLSVDYDYNSTQRYHLVPLTQDSIEEQGYQNVTFDDMVYDKFCKKILNYVESNTKEYLLGDLNEDGEIDIKDSAWLKRYLAGWDVLCKLKIGDINSDKELDMKDSALIKRYLAGWEESFTPVILMPSEQRYLSGIYEGEYDATQGRTACRITMLSKTKGIFEFYNIEGRNNAKEGSYYVRIKYIDDMVYMTETKWINRPSGYVPVNFVGSIHDDQLSGRVTNDNAWSFTISIADPNSDWNKSAYTFRNENLLNQHYEKHGIDMGFTSAKEYESAANKVILNPNSLHKKESEDNDDIYYLEETNEFVIVSVDGYIRTYFNPDQGIDYYNRQ